VARASDPFRLVVNRQELNRLLESPDGPVARDLGRKAQRVAAQARRRAPKKTGALKASIGWTIGSDELGLFAEVTARVPYSAPVEQGHRTDGGKRVRARRYLKPALYDVVRTGQTRAAK
jgi:hypothetical protein